MNRLLYEQIKALNDPNLPAVSRLSNMLAAVYNSDPAINWCGLYYCSSEGTCYLGPFQGKPACSVIPAHKGVIGACIDQKQPLFVDDVHQFPGHIACDSASKSEAVLPLYNKDHQLAAVLDLDSDETAHFDREAEIWLIKIAEILAQSAFCVTL